MIHVLKPFTESVTALRGNIFKAARIRLTLYYIFIMVLVVGIFSGILYLTLEKNIRDSVEENVGEHRMQMDTIRGTTDRLQFTLALSDALILVLISSLSYLLAGKTLEPIVKVFQTQKQFSADASHDLRTPLAIMRTDIEVTLSDTHKTPGQYKKTLESNLEEVEHMSRIVENLLLLSRLENEKKIDMMQAIKLSVFTEKIVEKFEEQARAKHITLTFASRETGSIFGVPTDLERALYNILQNAIHYTSVKGKISVEVLRHEDNMHVTIADSGIGIREEDVLLVFDRFFKASNSRNEYAAGSGLGLPIAQEIIQAHGGTLALQSVLGEGTTVTIALPKTA